MFELNAEQFELLVETLGTEPAFSLGSGAFWIATVSMLVALSVAILTAAEFKRSKNAADSDLILRSFDEYEELYSSLRAVPKLAAKNQEVLSLIDPTLEYNEAYFDSLAKLPEIDPEEWREARKLKLFYKSRFELVGKGFFTDRAIATTMDNSGINLARNELRKLDIAMFYQVRRARYKEGGFESKYLRRTFKNDLSWYSRIECFMQQNGANFGW